MVQQRSTFVEIIAWVFIVLAGFGVLIGILQNIMFFALFPQDMWAEAANEAQAQGVPAFAMFAYIRYLIVALLLIMIGVLVASINLLRRREWARKVFIGFMLFGIAWNLGGLAWQWILMGSFPFVEPQAGEFVDTFNTVRELIIGFSVAMALSLSALFGWIAWKLTRPQILAEFNAGKGT